MSSRIASREAKHEIASPSAQELALTKTLEELIMEREQLVHETARLGQEVRQLRQAASGDAESQAAQVLALKEIVVALTVRPLSPHGRACLSTTDARPASPAARKSTAGAAGWHSVGSAAAQTTAVGGLAVYIRK